MANASPARDGGVERGGLPVSKWNYMPPPLLAGLVGVEGVSLGSDGSTFSTVPLPARFHPASIPLPSRFHVAHPKVGFRATGVSAA